MTSGSQNEPEHRQLMIIPMIDIIFFLLVFFMAVSMLNMVTEKTIPVKLPATTTAGRRPHEVSAGRDSGQMTLIFARGSADHHRKLAGDPLLEARRKPRMGKRRLSF